MPPIDSRMTPTPGQLASAAAHPNTTPLERVARAINQARLDARDPFFHIDPEHCDYSKHLAAAALPALRDADDATTKAMCDAWYACPEGDGPEEITRAILAAAIGHILSQTPNQGSER